ncbi:flagellar protein FlgN [Halorhodospira halochloris]|uniref:Flagellar biosynthesis protein FlgN n=1 Tax=Halorhodospira halochloris TaxID=1052 RepID=A0A0X8XBZ5_HALHR|nr:flagellar protein FlgN [Halorhodospira halochloris]MCG5530023.1 flagellar protein FlgN [Halorhodospira halochloris]MCG5548296.1 flagellar protein FlgN [Halorhodospira halochloris]BAU58878.1 flagellar biosynthesis protein FlgN [Halorhodospira halochloris]
MSSDTSPEERSLSKEQIARLESRIERCRERAKALAETLDSETEMLAQRKIEGMDALLQRKSEQVTALEEAERKLSRLLGRIGLPEGRQGVRLALRSAPDRLDAAWQELESILQSVQARNEANGRLIHQNLEYTRRMIDLVAGAHDRSDEALYGTNGSRSAAQRSRKITQA